MRIWVRRKNPGLHNVVNVKRILGGKSKNSRVAAFLSLFSVLDEVGYYFADNDHIFFPLEVTLGVPILMPLVTLGLRVSNGIPFLLAVM